MSTRKNDPQEATRLARERAKKAERQYSKGTSGKGKGSQSGEATEKPLFTSDEIFAALQDNEQGDARLLAKALENRFAYDHKRNQFYRFENGYWAHDLVREINPESMRILGRAYATEFSRQHKIAQDAKAKDARDRAEALCRELRSRLKVVKTGRRIKAVLTESATCGIDSLGITGDQWNADPWVLQARGLLVDLRTGDAREGRPQDDINKAALTEWAGLHMQCSSWCDFITAVFDDNQELIHYVQKVLGSALVGLPNAQEFYIFWGSGSNGKGTLLETLRAVLGRDLASPIRSEMLMENRSANAGAPNPEIVDLQGRRIVWASETKEGQRLNAEKIKLFTGGDALSGRLNHSNEIIVFNPTHTLFMLTNFKPRVNANDAALWRRLRLIPFTQEFVHNPTQPGQRLRIDGLKDLLTEEASGILAWLVQGCIAWQKEGLAPPQEVLEAIDDYKLHEDPLQEFINERCILSPGHRSQAKPLYEAFTTWYEETYGAKAHPPNLRNFTDRLRIKFERDASGRHVFYKGIGLSVDDL